MDEVKKIIVKKIWIMKILERIIVKIKYGWNKKNLSWENMDYEN